MADGQDEVLGTYPLLGMSDEEIARNVIQWVTTSLQNSPSQQAVVVARLERELAALEPAPPGSRAGR
jgi:hypothetical protein